MPTAAVVAGPDPEIAPKNRQDKIVEAAMPPVKGPASDSATATRRLDMPADSMSAPADDHAPHGGCAERKGNRGAEEQEPDEGHEDDGGYTHGVTSPSGTSSSKSLVSILSTSAISILRICFMILT